MKNPIPLYSGVLNSIGCTIDSQGLISQTIIGSQPIPIDIDGRRLVLPTPEVLQGLDNSRMIAFHPICENITMGNSPVIEKFRRMVQMCIATRLSSLAYDLLHAIVGNEEKVLTGSILGLAEQIPDANKKTLTALEKVLQSMNGEDRTPIRIYLKRQAELNGEKYRREAAVHFPFMDEFADTKPNDYVYDVKMSKRDKNTLRILFNVLIPHIEKPNSYSAGSNSTVAPSFDALLRVTHKLCGEIGSRAYQYRKNLNIVDYRTDITWGDEEINLAEYANYIPNLDGNDGVIANNQSQTGTTVSVPTTPMLGYANTTPAALGAANMNNGIATSQNPGVQQTPAAAPTQQPFRGLGSAPPPNATAPVSGINTATRVAQAPVTNPSIYANPPMQQQGMMYPGMQMMPGMAPGMAPGMMPGMQMPGMMPGMGMPMPGMVPGMMPGMMPGMGMPGMMPGMQMMPGMGMPQQGLGQAPFPAVGQQPMQQPVQQMQQPMQQPMQQMMYPGMQMPGMMPGMQMQGMQPMGMQQGQPGGGLFKRA